MRLTFCLWLALNLLILVGAQEDWMSCEGFVKSSQPIDYSRLEIQLTNKKGALKDSIQFSPDGYYALPVYDRGTFRLRVSGPAGWSFEPKEVPVTNGVGGKQTCSQERGDINFVFTGVAVSGHVQSLCPSAQGVAGVSLTLKNKDSTTHSTTTSGADGQYTFSQVLAGTYSITASLTKNVLPSEVNPQASSKSPYQLSLGFAESSTEIEVGNDSLVLSEPIAVTTHSILGYVLADADSPMRGVSVGVSKDGKQVDEVESDGSGVFIVPSVPCGTYSLAPYFKGFQVTPSTMLAEVGGEDLFLTTPFRFQGFAVTGSVLGHDGLGIQDVEVKVVSEKGKTVTVVTDKDGTYSVDNLDVGKYDLFASKAHTKFDSLKKIMLSPSIASIPKISVKSYSLCGRVTLDATWTLERRIHLGGAGTKETTSDKDGNFCFDVAPGSYIVTPVVTEQETNSGLIIHPLVHSIEITRNPHLDAIFSQALVKVLGVVECIDPCPEDLMVQLQSVGRGGRSEASVGSTGTFEFQGVLPGKYNVLVLKDNWCWHKRETTIQVSDEDITNIRLAQSGFKLSYVLSHDDVVVDVEHTGGKSLPQKEFQLRKSDRVLCLPFSGKYQITPKSCYKYDQDSFQFHTQSPQVLELYATGLWVTGTVGVGPEVTDEEAKAVKIIVHSTRANRDTATPRVVPLVPKEGTKEGTYRFWTTFEEQLELVPKSGALLFYPQIQTLLTPKDKCPDLVVPFQAKPGMYLSGGIFPPVEGVRVTVHQGGSAVASPVISSPDGTYKIGPLYEDQSYAIHCQKQGYVFHPREGSKTDMNAKRLSTIVVKAMDSVDKSPLPGTFISLTGQGGYRNSTRTGANGEQEFMDLPPGTFFLRTILKEYDFRPPTHTISLDDGQLVEIDVIGRRTAFSCFGKLTSITGAPQAGIAVEAYSEDSIEEATTDENGEYRIRGLMPGVAYRVRVQQTSETSRKPKIERASPNDIPITVTKGDVHDMNFLVFRSTQSFDIVGAVDADEDILDNLEVQLAVPTTGIVIKTAPVSVTKYFELPNVKIPQNSMGYVVKIASSLPRHHKVQCSEVRASPFRDQSVLPLVDITLSCKASIKEVEPENPNQSSSLVGFVFIGGAVAAYQYRKKILQMIGSTPQGGRGIKRQ